MAQDTIRIRITDEGSLVIETDDISPANHTSADAALQALILAMGGPVTVTPRKPSFAHQHQTPHVHTHR